VSSPAIDHDELVRLLAERVRVQRLQNLQNQLTRPREPDLSVADLDASGHMRDPEPPALTVPPHYLP
jgi:hypothetical protein